MENNTQEFALMVNTYYILMEAADLVLRRAEFMLNTADLSLNSNVKHRHAMLMSKIAPLKNEVNTFSKLYETAFGENILQRYDALRFTANIMARIALLMGDRCSDSDFGQKESIIEEFIASMPKQGYLTDETLENFRMR